MVNAQARGSGEYTPTGGGQGEADEFRSRRSSSRCRHSAIQEVRAAPRATEAQLDSARQKAEQLKAELAKEEDRKELAAKEFLDHFDSRVCPGGQEGRSGRGQGEGAQQAEEASIASRGPGQGRRRRAS